MYKLSHDHIHVQTVGVLGTDRNMACQFSSVAWGLSVQICFVEFRTSADWRCEWSYTANGTVLQLNWAHPVRYIPLNLLQDTHGFKYGWRGSVPYHHHHHYHALSVIQKYSVNAVYPILHNAQRKVKHWNKAKHWLLVPAPCEGETYFSGITLHPVNTITRRYKWCHLKVMYQKTNEVSYSDVNGGNSIQFPTEIACSSTELPDHSCCLYKCKDRPNKQQHTHINHPARIEVVSMYAMKAHGGVEV